MCDHLELYRERFFAVGRVTNFPNSPPASQDTASAVALRAWLVPTHHCPGVQATAQAGGVPLTQGLEALQRPQASETGLPRVLLSQKKKGPRHPVPHSGSGPAEPQHAGYTTESPTILDLQSHIFVTLGLESLLPGRDGCIPFTSFI